MSDTTKSAEKKEPAVLGTVATALLNNQWRVKLQDKEGRTQFIRIGGSTSKLVTAKHGQWIANAQARRAVENGMEDPEIRVVSVEPIGHRDASLTGLPPAAGLTKINLNRYIEDADFVKMTKKGSDVATVAEAEATA